MSYILDALKKADRERRQGEIPDLKTALPATTSQASQHRTTLWLGAVAAIIIAVVWFKPWQSQMPAQQTLSPAPVNQNTATIQAPAVELPAIEPRSATPQRATVEPALNPQESQPVEAVAASAPPPAETEMPKQPAIANLMELPPHIRNSLPAIRISGHIHDATPASRMVIINDSVRREGRYISDSLMLETITEKGIILNANGTRFFMSTFDSWPR